MKSIRLARSASGSVAFFRPPLCFDIAPRASRSKRTVPPFELRFSRNFSITRRHVFHSTYPRRINAVCELGTPAHLETRGKKKATSQPGDVVYVVLAKPGILEIRQAANNGSTRFDDRTTLPRQPPTNTKPQNIKTSEYCATLATLHQSKRFRSSPTAKLHTALIHASVLTYETTTGTKEPKLGSPAVVPLA